MPILIFVPVITSIPGTNVGISLLRRFGRFCFVLFLRKNSTFFGLPLTRIPGQSFHFLPLSLVLPSCRSPIPTDNFCPRRNFGLHKRSFRGHELVARDYGERPLSKISFEDGSPKKNREHSGKNRRFSDRKQRLSPDVMSCFPSCLCFLQASNVRGKAIRERFSN